VFVMRGGGGEVTDELVPVAAADIPGLYGYALASTSLAAALRSSKEAITVGDPLQRSCELPMDGSERRAVNWTEVADWNPIRYDNRDPLDHELYGGLVAYRFRFRTRSKRMGILINIRRVGVVWCHGVACSNQIFYSHNVVTAGAFFFHAVDSDQAGKQRHNLAPGLAMLASDASGVHEVTILLLSFGQSGSSFLLNNVRNMCGLLSASISQRTHASNVERAISGVSGQTLDNA
jgi:hypothetical protein